MQQVRHLYVVLGEADSEPTDREQRRLRPGRPSRRFDSNKAKPNKTKKKSCSSFALREIIFFKDVAHPDAAGQAGVLSVSDRFLRQSVSQLAEVKNLLFCFVWLCFPLDRPPMIFRFD